mgnify:CR=1 FL=1|jgi:uncharacterized protein (DUF3084 family)|tara:strand:- start:5064 stop:5456 length:393 start_codon:yes stop_codon:yes gene_type:complete
MGFRWVDEDEGKIRGEVVNLRREKRQLEDDLAKLKHNHHLDLEKIESKKKIADEDIKHMVKMKEEKLQVEYEKNSLKNERSKDIEVAEIRDDYRIKIEQRLETEVKNMKEMYGEILKRLPNVNVRLKGDA